MGVFVYCYGEGVVYCDLKLDNILIIVDGIFVFVDFGMVFFVGLCVDIVFLEIVGIFGGSVVYMVLE